MNPISVFSGAALSVAFVTGSALASTTVSLYSGTFEGEKPSPALVGNVSRGDRFQIEVGRATALVNYPDPENPVIIERIKTIETGGQVSCPYFIKLDGTPQGTRIDQTHVVSVDHKVLCDDGGCTDRLGQIIPNSKLLFGKYNLPKCTLSTGADYGFWDMRWVQTPPSHCPLGATCGPQIETFPVCCPEFSVERTYSELHYFDRLLVVDSVREDSFSDLDINFRKIYLTFENDRRDQATCVLTDLVNGGDVITIDDLKDCVLPPGDHFTMYARSRFFLKDTRPCGKFVARGVKRGEDYVPDWFLGWYECDGKADRSPIEKQYTYATRVELTFIESTIGGNLQ